MVGVGVGATVTSLVDGLPRWAPRRSGTCLDCCGVRADVEDEALPRILRLWSAVDVLAAGDGAGAGAGSSSILAGVPRRRPLTRVEGAPFSLCLRVRRAEEGVVWEDASSGEWGSGE